MNTKTIKSIAKNTAKVALSVAVPPLGLAVSFPKDKGLGLTIGVIASAFIGLVIIAQKSSPHKIYDSPGIYQYERHNNFGRAFVELFTSPAALYFDNHKETIIQTADKELYDSGSIYTAAQLNGARVYGHDVITFSKEGAYTCNFGLERKFVTSKGAVVSVAGARNYLDGLVQEQGRLERAGNVLEARRLSEKVKDTRVSYNGVFAEYTNVKTAFDDAVAKMNAELDSLRDERFNQIKLDENQGAESK